MASDAAVLTKILEQLEALHVSQAQMQSKIDSMTSPASASSSRIATPPRKTAGLPIPNRTDSPSALVPNAASYSGSPGGSASPLSALAAIGPNISALDRPALTPTNSSKEREKALYPQRVIITTYPDQSGIKPVAINWGAAAPAERGPVVCSRQPNSIKSRNAIGAHSGSYSIYRALAIAIGTLDPHHKPNYALTDPPVDIP
ncbi:hypothetical protein FRC01_014817, partial [Tulasnella sp. 417]